MYSDLGARESFRHGTLRRSQEHSSRVRGVLHASFMIPHWTKDDLAHFSPCPKEPRQEDMNHRLLASYESLIIPSG